MYQPCPNLDKNSVKLSDPAPFLRKLYNLWMLLWSSLQQSVLFVQAWWCNFFTGIFSNNLKGLTFFKSINNFKFSLTVSLKIRNSYFKQYLSMAAFEIIWLIAICNKFRTDVDMWYWYTFLWDNTMKYLLHSFTIMTNAYDSHDAY